MESTHNKTNLASMRISNARLQQFIEIFERKTGVRLSEADALARAETLLRTMSILYKPVSKADYYSSLAQKMFFKTKKV